ncbi:MAG: 3-oxoacyl-[acyl-carrier-protein] synthase 3 [Meiothermus sp.]|uniref:3-oxoacyl-[acyl-carrier-protein] synthase 3 n=2 Tax=Meiothermus hypogaeus TaxID=884155 RepID=A0A511R1Q6_9DEIN|nr:3-oxoacyl-ACP synthase [Meiothermus hypogaeus]RIH80164.1 3-oxoacyl-[acyl-carrier-protein] synthase 3 [Meiothermus hypogaeus]GEM83539.1 3-oxoacyl-[acyl-carrier-protein] synthase 3 [Meiothermus hypogaeus NBRC 106114]GIW37668.1 MAG: 3-oxoacyl-[acyl-carrier-protein] synthase 3 [Meiothermus sp.]
MAYLRGLGVYLPVPRMTSGEIAAASGLPEWVVREKLGIHQKPVPGPEDHPARMGAWAAREALKEAGLGGAELDVVISITDEHKDFPVWTSAPLMAQVLDAHRAWCFDLNQKCATFITALTVAEGLFASRPEIESILIAGGYRNGDLIDYRDESVRFMYDLAAGGGAAVLTRHGPGLSLLSTQLKTDPVLANTVRVPVGGTVAPLTPTNAAQYKLRVAEPDLMKSRLEQVSLPGFMEVINGALRQAGYTAADLDYLALLHMKPSAHKAVLEGLGLGAERSIYLSDYGHLGQIDPILSVQLARQAGKIGPGSLLALAAAGVGYHWGAAVLRWEEEAAEAPWS